MTQVVFFNKTEDSRIKILKGVLLIVYDKKEKE